MSEPLKKAEKGFIARIGTVVSSLGARFSLATLIAAGGTVGVLLGLGYPRSAPSQPATITLGSGEDMAGAACRSTRRGAMGFNCPPGARSG